MIAANPYEMTGYVFTMVGKIDHHVRFSQFAFVDSDDRAHGVQLTTFIAARIASRLAEPLHGQSPLRTISGPGATPTLSRSRDGQAAKEGQRDASRLSPAVEYSLFCPDNVGYHSRYIRS